MWNTWCLCESEESDNTHEERNSGGNPSLLVLTGARLPAMVVDGNRPMSGSCGADHINGTRSVRSRGLKSGKNI